MQEFALCKIAQTLRHYKQCITNLIRLQIWQQFYGKKLPRKISPQKMQESAPKLTFRRSRRTPLHRYNTLASFYKD